MNKKFLPDMYCQNIKTIPYQKLKQNNIKYLIYDLDNTIRSLDEKKPSQELKDLIKSLKKDFTIILVSNNFKKEVSPFASYLDIDYFSFALKPSRRSLKKIMQKYKCTKEEMAMIGDQLMTDIYSANRFNCFSILVDPLTTKDLKITNLNRYLESKIIKKHNLLERGKYYDK